MARTVTNFSVWKKELDAYIEDEQANLPESAYKQIFTERSVSDLKMLETTWSGDRKMDAVSELGNAVEVDDLEGYSTTYSPQNYRNKKTFSSLMLGTDKTGKAEEMARSLATHPKYSRDLNMFSTFRRGWDTTFLLGTGKQLISTAQPRKDGGGTQYNTFTNGVQYPLEYDRVLQLQDVLISNVSNSGTLTQTGDQGRNKVIVVGPYLREDAFQIAGVNGPDLQPDTADNNKNYFRKGDRFDVLVTGWITYEAAVEAGETAVAKTASGNIWDTMWFLMDTKLCKKYFKVYTQEGYPKYSDEVKKANESLVKYAYDAYAYGVTNWLGVAGSKGDSTTFSS